MDPRAYYTERAAVLRAALAQTERRMARLSSARVATFVVGASAIGAHVFGDGSPPALAAGVGLMVVLAGLVVWHARVAQREQELAAGVLFCERGLARAGDGAGLPGRGQRPAIAGHPYAADLDLIGEGSVLARLDAMETALSEERLTAWLLAPAPAGEVRERQRAVAELSALTTLREELFVHGRAVATGHPDLGGFVAWCQRAGGPGAGLQAVAIALPLATLALFVLRGEHGVPTWAWGLTAAAQWVMTLTLGGGPDLDLASRGAEGLGKFRGVLGPLGQARFASERLGAVAARLGEARDGLGQLERIASWAEARHNALFRLMVGPAVLYDVQLALALGRWRRQHGARVAGWLEALAETLALAGLGTYAFDHPAATMPELVEGPASFAAEGLAHPLLPPDRRVDNDVHLSGPGQALLITGSNMAGKSTLLRAMGIAAVLAQAGAPVEARRLALTPSNVRTSIRVSDSLASGYSHFYAELLALKRVVDEASQGPVLFLLDEILHGTNSAERQAGAKAVIAHLLRQGSLGVVTTHDLGLAELVDELPGQVTPVHLLEHQEGDRMTFDYRLRPGLLRSGNALALMRQLGLPV